MDPQAILGWLRRLIALDTKVFDEIRANPAATVPAVIIVSLATFLFGLGGWLWWTVEDFGQRSDVFIHSAVIGSLVAIVLWGIAWLGLVYVMLSQVFRERVYLEQLLRVMGLAAAPLCLGFLMFIPGLSFAIALAAVTFTFGLTGIAIQSVTTANAARVLAANAAGFALWALVLTFLASTGAASVKPNAPGIFLYRTTASVTSDFVNLGNQLEDLLQ